MKNDLLQGRVAIVTGAGRGIGRAISLALASVGATVVVAARTMQEIEETAAAIEEAGGTAYAQPVDVADYASVQQLVKQAIARFGKVDILVNNAGIQGAIGPLDTNDPEIWKHTINVNLIGSFNCCHAVLPGMKARQSGKIVNLSGGGATAPRPNFSAYGAAKAAIVRLTETLAVELKDANIQVNVVAPGAVNTRMLTEVLEAGVNAGGELEAAQRREVEGGTPPSLAAELVVFLASPESDELTGKLIAAPYDAWRSWTQQDLEQLSASPWLTLRRIDPYTIRPLIEAVDDKFFQA